MHMDLQTAVEAILKSKDPVTMVGDLIVAEGGFGTKAKQPTKDSYSQYNSLECRVLA